MTSQGHKKVNRKVCLVRFLEFVVWCLLLAVSLHQGCHVNLLISIRPQKIRLDWNQIASLPLEQAWLVKIWTLPKLNQNISIFDPTQQLGLLIYNWNAAICVHTAIITWKTDKHILWGMFLACYSRNISLTSPLNTF